MRKIVDKLDTKIIELLIQDGRMPNTEIAKRLNLSEAATRKRLKRLIDNEIIRVGAYLNYMKLGHAIEGNLKIKADIKKHDEIAEKLYAMASIIYLVHTTGAIDFDLEFSVKSQAELRDLLEAVRHIDGVYTADVSIRLKLMKLRFDRLEL